MHWQYTFFSSCFSLGFSFLIKASFTSLFKSLGTGKFSPSLVILNYSSEIQRVKISKWLKINNEWSLQLPVKITFALPWRFSYFGASFAGLNFIFFFWVFWYRALFFYWTGVTLELCILWDYYQSTLLTFDFFLIYILHSLVANDSKHAGSFGKVMQLSLRCSLFNIKASMEGMQILSVFVDSKVLPHLS